MVIIIRRTIVAILALGLVGCRPTSSIIQSTNSSVYPSSTAASSLPQASPSSFLSATNTVVLSNPSTESSSLPSPFVVFTPVNTLEPDNAADEIGTMLRDTLDCSSPCFWNIFPGKTKTEEAVSIFSHYGIEPEIIPYDGTDYYNFAYALESGLSLLVILPISNLQVKSIWVSIQPGARGDPQEWLAYSPKTIIESYGDPTRVDFSADWAEGSYFSMQLYFSRQDLIVQYAGQDIISRKKGLFEICPLTTDFETIRVWFGKDPNNPPGLGVSLEEATDLTLREFADMLNRDQENACLWINGDTLQ